MRLAILSFSILRFSPLRPSVTEREGKGGICRTSSADRCVFPSQRLLLCAVTEAQMNGLFSVSVQTCFLNNPLCCSSLCFELDRQQAKDRK